MLAFLSTPEGWIELAKGYGLGVLTLGLFIWHLRDELKAARNDLKAAHEREEKSEAAMLALTRETLGSLGNLGKVIDSLTPAIGTLSQSHRDQIERSTADLKAHMTNVCDQLKIILSERK